jgi:hypothetical protein
MYGKGLERVEVFKYLGCLLAYNNNNSQAVRGNLKKARGIWAWISFTLRAEIAYPRVCGVKATAQSILLFGSETWNSSPVSLKVLKGFHIRAAWHMVGKRLMKLHDGTWMYPNSVDVLNGIGLKTIAHYIAVHWQHRANYIVNKPIFLTCVSGGRRRGSSVHQFWWEQSMDLEVAQEAHIAGPVVISDDKEETRQ